jgi:hypothetical protein
VGTAHLFARIEMGCVKRLPKIDADLLSLSVMVGLGVAAALTHLFRWLDYHTS